MEEIMNVRCRSFGVLVATAAAAARPLFQFDCKRRNRTIRIGDWVRIEALNYAAILTCLNCFLFGNLGLTLIKNISLVTHALPLLRLSIRLFSRASMATFGAPQLC